jgi:thioredoxin 2
MSAEIIRCPNCGHRNRVPAAAAGFPNCGHCHQPLPWIAGAGDATFAEVAEAAGIQSIPTLMVIRQGQVLARQAGAAPADALRAWLEQSLAADSHPA